MRVAFDMLQEGINKREENTTMRVFSAIGIICVVMGHLGCSLLELDSWVPFYSFHMALFAFISGYFYSKKNDAKPFQFIKKKTRTILIPYYAVILLYLLIQTWFRRYGITFGLNFSFFNWIVRPWISCQPLGFATATWFMIALFITETVYVLIRTATRFIKSDGARDGLLLLAIGLAGVMVIIYSPYPEEWQRVITRPFFLMFFLHLGLCYREYAEGRIHISTPLLLGIMMIMRACITSLYGRCDYGLWNCDFGEAMPWYVVFLVSIIGICFWLRVAKAITPIVKKNGLLVYIGRHSREIMCHHLFTLFLAHGAINKIQSFYSIPSVFDVQAWKTNVYYHYNPWVGYSLLLTTISIAGVLGIVWIKEKSIERIKKRKLNG